MVDVVYLDMIEDHAIYWSRGRGTMEDIGHVTQNSIKYAIKSAS